MREIKQFKSKLHPPKEYCLTVGSTDILDQPEWRLLGTRLLPDNLRQVLEWEDG
jgi:hypothetical protein